MGLLISSDVGAHSHRTSSSGGSCRVRPPCGPSAGDQICLACNAVYEARGEPLDGEIATDQVAISRARSGQFRSSICGTIYQPSQFAWTHNGSPSVTCGEWQRAQYAAQEASSNDYKGKLADGYKYFFASSGPNKVNPRWAKNCRPQPGLTIGHHTFFQDCGSSSHQRLARSSESPQGQSWSDLSPAKSARPWQTRR